MRLLKRKKPEELTSPDAESLRERAKKLSDEEILDGLDQFISNAGVYFSGFRRSRDWDLVRELQATASGLYVLTEVLLKRQDNPLDIPEPEKPRAARQVRSY